MWILKSEPFGTINCDNKRFANVPSYTRKLKNLFYFRRFLSCASFAKGLTVFSIKKELVPSQKEAKQREKNK